MLRRITLAQYNAKVRQHNRDVKRAVTKYNSEVRAYNNEVRKRRRAYLDAVAQYNRRVNTYNAQVRSNRAKLLQQAKALQSSTSIRYVDVKQSTVELLQRFERVADEPYQSDAHSELVFLAQVESSNSAAVAEKLLADAPEDAEPETEPTGILSYLEDMSLDLLARWQGAIYALNPVNPDAGRHFCTSVREIFTEILEKWATDQEVIEANPLCHRTPNGSKPTRRAKIKYLLDRKSAGTPEMIGFVEADIENVVRLFDDFNEGTHGPAGKFGFARLQAIKRRVEGGIMFLATIAA